MSAAAWPRIAYFISSHGFGHAARSAAIMAAVQELLPDVGLEIFTTVPEWFFGQSLRPPLVYHSVVSDVGLVQTSPLDEDLPATVGALERFWGDADERVEGIASLLGERPPQAVVCDISPLGLLLARRMGLPSVLVENFTWDWIYAAYHERESRLREFGRQYAELANSATARIQLEPVCESVPGASRVGPVSREPGRDRDAVRKALGLESCDRRPLIVLSMGGMGWDRADAVKPGEAEALFFVALGGGDELVRSGNLVRLPDRSPVYPPDLFWASDVVVGKLGYSTVADCYRAGVRFGFIEREHFPESPVLGEFVSKNLSAVPIGRQELEAGSWIQRVEELLRKPHRSPRRENGAVAVAERIVELVANPRRTAEDA